MAGRGREKTQEKDLRGFENFKPLKSMPVRVDLTESNGGEREVLARSLEPGRVDGLDRGYGKLELFREILDVGSSFVCRGPPPRRVANRPVTGEPRAERDCACPPFRAGPA